MPSGIVKTFFAERRFGFISHDSSKPDLFFHVRECPGAIAPKPGARVTFELSTDKSGRPTAIGVKTIDDGDLA